MKISKIIPYSICFVLLFFSIKSVSAQEKEETSTNLEDDLIANIFNYGILINTQTTETIAKKSWEFRIQHRFGELDFNNFNETIIDEFLGFDGSANIRLSLSFALSDNLQIGIGRTKFDKVVDFEFKHRLWRQRESGSGFSGSIYFNTAIATAEFSEIGPNEFFDDLTTPFENKSSHRYAYNTQLLLSRKFGEKFSLLLNPTFIYNNLVPAGYDNLTFGTTFGGRLQTGLQSSIIFEFATKFNNRKDNFKDPISIGYEIGTAGHAFQIFFSTTNQIVEQDLFSTTPLDYTDGKFLIGFNIKRTFWRQ